MPPRKDDFGALLTAGLLGFDPGMVAASSMRVANELRREQFRTSLRTALLTRSLALLTTTFGRGPDNQAFWDLTLQWPEGDVSGVRVLLPPEVQPYSGDALKTVLDHVGVVADRVRS